MGDVVKCLPCAPFPMHEFLKAKLLFRSSMERQNSLAGTDQEEERKTIRVNLEYNTHLKQKCQDPSDPLHNPKFIKKIYQYNQISRW